MPRPEDDNRDWYRFLLQMVIPILIVLFCGLGAWALSLERNKADRAELQSALSSVKTEIMSDLSDIKRELEWNRRFHEKNPEGR